MKRRIPLNPCDYLYFAHHRHMRRRRIGGAVGFLILECDGMPEPPQVQAAFSEAILAHPTTMATLKVGRILGRPFWHLSDPGTAEHAACHAAQQAYVFDDLRGEPDSDEALRRLLEARFVPDWNLMSGPQVRLEQYAMGDNRTCFCLRFPHALMDAGGGQWFLAELGRYSPPAATDLPPPASAVPPGTALAPARPMPRDLPEGLAPDDRPIRPLSGYSLVERLRLCVAGLKLGADYRSIRVDPLTPSPAPLVASQGIIHRCWPAAMVRKMRINADKFSPPGPASHARYLAACVIRALHTLYTERGLHADAYPVSLPLSVTDDNQADEAYESATSEPISQAAVPSSGSTPRQRPLPGNYLVAPTLYGMREMVHDRAALGRDLLAQLNRYLSKRGDLAQWAMIQFASWLRVWMYDLVFKRGIGLEPLASGFSYYGQIPRPVRRICGAKVTNLWGTAPLGTPPGWNPIFNKYQGKLNLGFAFNRPAISDELAERFVNLIEQEAFSDG